MGMWRVPTSLTKPVPADQRLSALFRGTMTRGKIFR